MNPIAPSARISASDQNRADSIVAVRFPLVLNNLDRLARAQTHRQIDLRAQRRWRLLLEHITAIVVAQLEDSASDLDAASISLAQTMVHNDSHRIIPHVWFLNSKLSTTVIY
jgi:hypothetical protein